MKKFLLSLLCFFAVGLPMLAEETVVQNLTFSKSNYTEGISSYANEWIYKQNELEWTLTNFNNNNKGWDYVKCGPKNTESEASITTNFAIDTPIDEIRINLGAITNGSITDLSVFVSTDKNFEIGDVTKFSYGSEISTSGEISIPITPRCSKLLL